MKPILLVVGVILTAVPLSAGPQSAAPAAQWKATRTSDGHPDLQGTWTTQTYTPLQRPDRFAGREFLTDAEMAELTALMSQAGVDPLAGGVLAASDEELVAHQALLDGLDKAIKGTSVWRLEPAPPAQETSSAADAQTA